MMMMMMMMMMNLSCIASEFPRQSEIVVEKIAIFHTHLHSTPPLRGPCQNIAIRFNMQPLFLHQQLADKILRNDRVGR